MVWKIEFDSDVVKDLKKISKPEQNKILKYLSEKIANLEDPRSTGKPLKGSLGGLWRYRVGDYRAICKIEDKSITILVLGVAHRKNVYKN